jgi:hypothetical protein
MSNNNLGEVIQPTHCRASGSFDKTKVALTFESENRTPVTIVIPLAGAVDLQRNLAQALYIMTAKPPVANTAAAEPVLAVAE